MPLELRIVPPMKWVFLLEIRALNLQLLVEQPSPGFLYSVPCQVSTDNE